MRAMRFEHSGKVVDAATASGRVHGRARLPQRGDVSPPDRGRRSVGADGDRRGAQAKGSRRWSLESVPARKRIRRRVDQHRVRAALRNHGPRARVRARGLQLLGAGHRQHGSAGPLRFRGAAPTLARTAAGGPDPFVLRDDRAGSRFVGRHQHPVAHRTRRRRATSSTATNGGPQAPATRAARSRSSWASRIPPRRGTSSSR